MSEFYPTGYIAEYSVTNTESLPMRVICDTPEFNGAVVQPGDSMRIPIFVPSGMRHWSKKTYKDKKPIIWISVLDEDAPEI